MQRKLYIDRDLGNKISEALRHYQGVCKTGVEVLDVDEVKDFQVFADAENQAILSSDRKQLSKKAEKTLYLEHNVLCFYIQRNDKIKHCDILNKILSNWQYIVEHLESTKPTRHNLKVGTSRFVEIK